MKGCDPCWVNKGDVSVHMWTPRGESVHVQLAGQSVCVCVGRAEVILTCTGGNWSISCSQEGKNRLQLKESMWGREGEYPKKKHIIVLSLARLELPNTWQAATKERQREQNNTEGEDLEELKADKRATDFSAWSV